MLISTKHKKIVLNLRNPDRVLTVIPTAKAFEYKGHTLVAVPHKQDEVRVLRNLGIEAPGPIRHYYPFPGRFRPFSAQLDTCEFMSMHSRAFVLNDMGTGKTMSTLWAFDYLRSIGQANKALVISPLSTLERTWGDEIFRNFPHLTFATLHGTRDKRLKLLNNDSFDVYIINHDGIKTAGFVEALKARDDIDTIVVDELSAFRTSGTDRFKSLKKIVQNRRVWGLTGTPIPNGPTDAWAQCVLINPDRVPKYFGKFRDAVLKQIGPFKWVPRESALEIVREAMQPAIRFKRDECVDLPPTVYATRHAPLSDEQKAAYKEMVKQLKTEYEGGQILAVNEAVKFSKLLQICCGVAYANGEEIVIPHASRMSVVEEVVEEAGTKVIIFVPFTGSLNHIAEQLSKTTTVAVIDGSVSKSARDIIFRDFQDAENPRVIVAQPAAMSHGLTLTAASTIIWYAPITSNEIYLQANARIVRPGQKHSQLIVNIEGSEVERKLYARLEGKQKQQGTLLDMLKDL